MPRGVLTDLRGGSDYLFVSLDWWNDIVRQGPMTHRVARVDAAGAAESVACYRRDLLTVLTMTVSVGCGLQI